MAARLQNNAAPAGRAIMVVIANAWGKGPDELTARRNAQRAGGLDKLPDTFLSYSIHPGAWLDNDGMINTPTGHDADRPVLLWRVRKGERLVPA